VGVFCNTAKSRKEVAVAKLSLVYVIRTDVLVENCLADVHFRDSLPWEIFGGVLCEWIFCIKTFDKRVCVWWEFWIGPLLALFYHSIDKVFHSHKLSFHL